MLTTLPIAAYSMRTAEPTVPQYTSPVVMPMLHFMLDLENLLRICAAAESARWGLSR